jgi:hypothetical protein
MQIRPVGAELFLANQWTDTTKLAVVFRSFPNAPKKEKHAKISFSIIVVTLQQQIQL